MPLPFILVGAAIVAAGYGIKKGVDAKNDLDEVKKYDKNAQRLAKNFEIDLDRQKAATNEVLHNYGQLKKNAAETVVDFQSLFDITEDSSIKNEFKESKRIILTKEEEIAILKKIGAIDSDLSLKEATNQIHANQLEFSTINNGLQSIAAGSLAGAAAAGGSYLGVGYLATASTGTAISGLSGAAATNATLAWLGGGSLASGGMGMAGGTMVLGGLVAGPLLAIGGSVFAAKAAEAKDKAINSYNDIEVQIAKGRIVISKLKAIEDHTVLCHSTCENVLALLRAQLQVLYQYANKNMHYRDMSDEGKQNVVFGYAMAFQLKDFITLGIINEKGDDVNPKSIDMIDLANSKLNYYRQ